MLTAIMFLTQQLRKAGVNITLVETLDACQGLALIELEKDQVYYTLRSTLIKNYHHYYIFDRLFSLVFANGIVTRQLLSNHEAFKSVPIDDDTGVFNPDGLIMEGDCAKTGLGFGSGLGLRVDGAQQLLQVIKLGDSFSMKKLAKAAIDLLGPLAPKHMQKADEALREVKVMIEWKTAEHLLKKEVDECSGALNLGWLEKFFALEELLKQELEDRLIDTFGQEALNMVLTRNNLAQLDFYKLNQNQIGEMRLLVTRLGHSLATKKSRRMVLGKHGRVCLPGTIRKAMSYGGVPIRPVFRSRKLTKPKLVILCDISGSVKIFSEFMLQLTYTMQRKFSEVRSFVFVDTIDEITSFFKLLVPEEAITKAYNEANFSLTGFSDYGAVIKEFWQKYGEVLDAKTSVVILGDARNNYQQPALEYWTIIQKLSKNVFWLNPEKQENWNTEDNIINSFAPYCTNVFECRNLQQLKTIARHIFAN